MSEEAKEVNYCETCESVMSTQAQLKDHYQSKAHQQKVSVRERLYAKADQQK